MSVEAWIDQLGMREEISSSYWILMPLKFRNAMRGGTQIFSKPDFYYMLRLLDRGRLPSLWYDQAELAKGIQQELRLKGTFEPVYIPVTTRRNGKFWAELILELSSLSLRVDEGGTLHLCEEVDGLPYTFTPGMSYLMPEVESWNPIEIFIWLTGTPYIQSYQARKNVLESFGLDMTSETAVGWDKNLRRWQQLEGFYPSNRKFPELPPEYERPDPVEVWGLLITKLWAMKRSATEYFEL